jgi:hypothetical protein
MTGIRNSGVGGGRLAFTSIAEQGVTQGVVDHCLVTKPLVLGHGASSFQDNIIEHDGDSGFSFAGNNRSSLGIAEVVFVFH